MKHFPLREMGYALGFVALLAAAYFGTYYALVERVGFNESNESNPFSRDLDKAFEPSPRYGIESTALENLFAPAHALDRQLRPDFWSEDAVDCLGRLYMKHMKQMESFRNGKGPL
jgi:hypothetical protein